MRVLVLGAAVSGISAARFSRTIADDVIVYDRDPDALVVLAQEGFATSGGKWNSDLLDGVDVVVSSPGIPEHAQPIQDTLSTGLPLWSELELAGRYLECRVVAVTGTNGKTTVTDLIAQMLTKSGKATMAAGNIGTALTSIVDVPLDVAVVEASSFQLRFIEEFSPDVAVVLNVASDHLDWHGDAAAYGAAKANIVLNAGIETPLVFNADDPGAISLARGSGANTIPVSGVNRPMNGWGVDGDRLVLDGFEVPLKDVPATDSAYRLDLVAAGAAALLAGASESAVRSVISGFSPGAHRRATVGVWREVAWVDDSKATNPHAAVASADSYSSVVLIAGGRNKDLDLQPLVTHRNVKSVIAIGEASEDVISAGDGRAAYKAETMADAVAQAAAQAEPGDTVLLAPGCTSWDMYSSYAERGDVFAAEVRRFNEETK